MPDMNPFCISRVASVDLTAHHLNIVAARTANCVDVASLSNPALTAGPIGVLYNKPKAGQMASVAVFGQARVRAGAAIAVHKMVTTNASGRAVEAASGDIIIGRALGITSADGEILDVLLQPVTRLGGGI